MAGIETLKGTNEFDKEDEFAPKVGVVANTGASESLQHVILKPLSWYICLT